jgi:hypothetical protein
MAERTENRTTLTVEGPAAFVGALVDALQRHGVEVGDVEAPPVARTLDTDQTVTVDVPVTGGDDDIEAAVGEFVEEYPEAIVREANGGLG